MPTNFRLQRGQRGERSYRTGYGVPESIKHVIQNCLITSNAKTARHNAPLRHLSHVLQRKGYEVAWKPNIRAADGFRKPDLVAIMGRFALVIDAHIVGDNVDMMAARYAKIQKYSDNPGIDAAIKSKPGVVEVRPCPLVITSRGIGCHKSAEDLIGLGVLTRKDILLMSVWVIEGSLKELWIFARATSIK